MAKPSGFVRSRQWCGCIIRYQKGTNILLGTVVEFCGIPHRDARTDPGYPGPIPRPVKKLTIKKGKKR
jgi:hypothetical protein